MADGVGPHSKMEFAKPAYGRSLDDFKYPEFGLLKAEALLLDAVRTGSRCDVGVRGDGREKQKPAPEAVAIEKNRAPQDKEITVRADFIRFLLLGGDRYAPVHERGVWITGAVVEGNLDLTGCEDVRPLALEWCWITGRVILRNARTRTVNLDYGHVEGNEVAGVRVAIEAKHAIINGSFYARNSFKAVGEINFIEAKIMGSLECQGGHFLHDGDQTFSCSRVKVLGSVFFNKGCRIEGEARFQRAEIGGDLNCESGVFLNGGGQALFFSRAKITGSAFLGKGMEVAGAADFIDAEIGNSLECRGGRFFNPNGVALCCKRAKIAGSVFLSDGFSADGEVCLRNAAVGGHLIGSQASFGTWSAGCKALSCEGAKITGNASFLRSAAAGEMNFSNAEIGGALDCSGSAFVNRDGAALICSRARVRNNVSLNGGFRAEGQVLLGGVTIGGQLNCSRGTFLSPGRVALVCIRMKVTDDVHLSHKFHASGEVQMKGAEISGRLVCNAGVFDNPEQTALDCEAIKIAGSASLAKGFCANGEVNFRSAEIGKDMECTDGRFQNRKVVARAGRGERPRAGNALDLAGARIHGALWLGSLEPGKTGSSLIEGSIDLQRANVGAYGDQFGSWPVEQIQTDEHGPVDCVISLDGFTYGRFVGAAPTDAGNRKTWLLRQRPEHLKSSFRPQPFEQVIAVLSEMGHSRDATEMAVFKQQMLTNGSVARAHWLWRPFVWLWGHFLGLSIGYGYRSHRMVIAATFVWLACGFIYQSAAEQALFAPTNPRVYLGDEFAKLKEECRNWTAEKCPLHQVKGHSLFEPFIFSLDVILPIVDLRQESDWQPAYGAFEAPVLGELPFSFVRGVMWFEILFGWAASLILASVVGGVIKRE